MSDIIDRLITYVEYRGIHEAITGLTNINTGINDLRNAQYRLSQIQSWAASVQSLSLRNQAKYVAALAEATAELTAAQTVYNNALAVLPLIGVIAFASIETAAIKTAMAFENMTIKLSGLYSSAAKGKEAFSFIKEMSLTSPFSISQNTTDYIRLLSEGINPSARNLLVTQAVGFTRDMDPGQIAAIIGRAGLGNTRGLRQLGVGQADIKAIDAANITSKGQFKDFNKAVNDIFDLLEKRYKGVEDMLADSSATKINEIKTAWSLLLDTVAQIGGLHAAKDVLDGFARFIMGLTVEFAFLSEILGEWNLFLAAISGNKTRIQAAKDAIDAAKDTIRMAGDYFAGYKGNPPNGVPSNLGHSEADSGMARVLREVLGGGAIAKIGIKASELPGIGPTRNPTIRVKLEGSEDHDFMKGLEHLMSRVLREAIIHNAIPIKS